MRRWLTFFHNGRRWVVALVPASHPALNRPGEPPLMGVTLFLQRLILINEEYTQAEQRETLVHEVCHVFGESAELGRTIEERFIEAIDGPLSRFVARLGFSPPKPEPKPKRARRRSR
jgi:hypothetical protein